MSERDMSGGLEKVLDRHGYGFHYSVLRKCQALYDEGRSEWGFEAAEFPVEVRGAATRVDFILKSRSGPWYMLAECKRVNPALSNWCFVTAPYYRRNQKDRELVAERAHCTLGGEIQTSVVTTFGYQGLYHIGLEVRSGEKGDCGGKGRGAIEEASTQVGRGLNGFLSFLAAHPQPLQIDVPATFLPVIFTTARLFVSEVDLSAAELDTGKLPAAAVQLEEKDWIWLQYHLSPGLKHRLFTGPATDQLAALLTQEYVRTIAVVSSQGIASFLTRDWWWSE